MRKKIIISVVIILLAVTAFYILRPGGEKKAVSIRTSGIVEGMEVNISTRVAGRIAKISCREGDSVEKGRTVIRLESRELISLVEQAKAGIERAKAEVGVSEASLENSRAVIQSAEAGIINAAADLEKIRVLMEEARKEMQRANSLYEQELISKETYDRSAAAYNAYAAEYKSSQAKLASARAKKASAEAGLNLSASRIEAAKGALQEAEANLSYHRARLDDTVITTPISGTVVFRALEEGETVVPGVTVLTIVDMENLYIRTDIEETRIGAVALNSRAVITAEGVPGKEFYGRVSEIGREAEFATQRDVVRGRQDIKTFRVKIKLDNPEGILKPGMTVDVEIPGEGLQK
ncbi:MAG TPA: HlyD family efflux transporter periplasmic adaptor subunit [Nitrospirae bacterium]|nr:HlyD family efflux transporter periplasmic adaptor subunit [Nitrospirota bacterium]